MLKYRDCKTKEFLFNSKRSDLTWCVIVDGVIMSKCSHINSASVVMSKFENEHNVQLTQIEVF